MTDIKEIRMALPSAVVESGKFSDNDLRVLDALNVLNGMEYARENGEFFVTNERLKELSEVNHNMKLNRSLKKLEKYGFFERKPGRRGEATVYILHEEKMEQFTNANTNQKKESQTKKTVTLMENKVTSQSDDMILIINELKQLQETVTQLVTEIVTLNANLLKISIGHNSHKNGCVTTDTDTESETEMSLIRDTCIVTSPEDKKKEEKEKRKFSPAGDARESRNVVVIQNEVSDKGGDTPEGRRDANGAFLNEKPAVAQRPSGGNHPDPSSGVSHKEDFPTASGVGDSAYPHSGEQGKNTPPPPAPAENANKRHLSAPGPQNELPLKPEGENPSGGKPEPQGAFLTKEDVDRRIAWAEAAMKAAEETGDREAFHEALKARMSAALTAQCIPYPDTEPLGMVVSDVHDTLTQRAYGKRRGEAVAHA